MCRNGVLGVPDGHQNVIIETGPVREVSAVKNRIDLAASRVVPRELAWYKSVFIQTQCVKKPPEIENKTPYRIPFDVQKLNSEKISFIIISYAPHVPPPIYYSCHSYSPRKSRL
eukprot:2317462-Rhodomonas_salina.3